MGRVKEYVKQTALYEQSFFLQYFKESFVLPWWRRSFAEYGEDLMTENLLGKKVEFFIDVGANDGFHSSNTFYFALRGAGGICFEPIAGTYARLRSLYRVNRRVTCRQCGLSDENKQARMVSLEGLSYLPETQDAAHKLLHLPEHAKNPKLEEIQLLRFEDAIAGLKIPRTIDLLSVDVEGHELKVLQAIPFEHYQFQVIIVETHQRGPDCQYRWRHRDYREIVETLASSGYTPVHETTANTIFLRHHAMVSITRPAMAQPAAKHLS